MEDSAPTGFVARNNEVLGSLLSIGALVVSAGLGAGLMLGTGTRGISAILTVVTITFGTFTLLFLAIGATLRAITAEEQWDEEETTWRSGMDLPPLFENDEERAAGVRRKVALGAVVAIVVGLALSVLPAAI